MSADAALHEDLTREDIVTPGSDRSFGLVFAGVFAVIVIAGLWRGHHLRVWALALSAAFLLAALVAPAVLAPLNAAWARFGLLLHRVTSPIIVGLTYALAIVPVGLLMRWSGKDPLRRRFDSSLRSYWIDRTPPGPPPGSMTRQY